MPINSLYMTFCHVDQWHDKYIIFSKNHSMKHIPVLHHGHIILKNNGGGPSSAHCILSLAPCTCKSNVGCYTNLPCNWRKRLTSIEKTTNFLHKLFHLQLAKTMLVRLPCSSSGVSCHTQLKDSLNGFIGMELIAKFL